MFCKNCGRANSDTNTRCEACNSELVDYSGYNLIHGKGKNIEISETEFKRINLFANILILIFVGPFLLCGLAFFGIGLVSNILEYNQAENYEKTTAILKSYDYFDDGLYEAIYEYEVNGKAYTVSPNLISDKSGFKTVETVYYNPNKPSESIIYSRWGGTTIMGVILVSAVIAIFIGKKIFLKRKFKVCGSAIKRM